VLAADDVLRAGLESDIITISPGAKLLETCGGLVGQLADDGGVEERLDLDGSGEVQLLRLGLRCLVPLLENLGECGTVDLNKLLQLVQVIGKLLEALLEGSELGGPPRDAMTGLKDLLLIEESLETDFELSRVNTSVNYRGGTDENRTHLGLLLQVKGVDLLEFPFLSPR
jgi:hypothetical protein